MKAEYLANTTLATLLDPTATVWQQAVATTIPLTGTPAAMQPTAAIRNSWADRPIGATSELSVASLHNGVELAFLLRWQSANPTMDNGDNSVFPDGAAVALPLVENAPLMTMGAPGAGLDIWFWRADQGDTGREISAEGPGSTETLNTDRIHSKSQWQGGTWSVVIARSFAGSVIARSLAGSGHDQTLALSPGETTQCGFAIWQGANEERGGIKSYSADWLELQLAGRR